MVSISVIDEKHPAVSNAPSNSSVDHQIGTTTPLDPALIPTPTNTLQRLANRLETIAGIEARGIERVPESERERKYAAKDYLYMAMIWFSANSYISTFGPMSGNRTLVIARYTMGWWPSKLCVLLNLVIELGYGVVDTIVAGLILSAVNGQGMSVIVGIVVAALISWAISTFGIKFFNIFERYTWIPQVCILFIFVGVASPHFDVKTPSSSTGATLIGNRLSYVFLSASGPLGWSAAAADFYVYFPPKASRLAVFCMTASGLILGKLFVEFMGIGLGSGLSLNPTWVAADKISTGSLIVEALSPLGSFGNFCAVLLALGVVANNIPGTYSASLSFQLLGGWAVKVPRMVWSTISVVIYTICAIAGRAYLLTIFLNFLSLIGYWTIIWITLTIEEEFIFRRKTGYNWELIGDYGSDVGLPIAASWAAITYPPCDILSSNTLVAEGGRRYLSR
ncbi:related to nucleoside transporter [Phialocephala subalpina]|uniref:Related to nucleoside transporter n=1 Tax=Phialocephala subalpina TaxID=576137 RepID=A0A1L7WS30_9HELO|nr:related to nucleoside transporter [Phialocephala subalpina]